MAGSECQAKVPWVSESEYKYLDMYEYQLLNHGGYLSNGYENSKKCTSISICASILESTPRRPYTMEKKFKNCQVATILF